MKKFNMPITDQQVANITDNDLLSHFNVPHHVPTNKLKKIEYMAIYFWLQHDVIRQNETGDPYPNITNNTSIEMELNISIQLDDANNWTEPLLPTESKPMLDCLQHSKNIRTFTNRASKTYYLAPKMIPEITSRPCFTWVSKTTAINIYFDSISGLTNPTHPPHISRMNNIVRLHTLLHELTKALILWIKLVSGIRLWPTSWSQASFIPPEPKPKNLQTFDDTHEANGEDFRPKSYCTCCTMGTGIGVSENTTYWWEQLHEERAKESTSNHTCNIKRRTTPSDFSHL